jgi:hypothetical protein
MVNSILNTAANKVVAGTESHNWFSGIGSVLGGIIPGGARLGDGPIVCAAQISRGSALAQRVALDLQDGIHIPLSVGYKIHRTVEGRSTKSDQLPGC